MPPPSRDPSPRGRHQPGEGEDARDAAEKPPRPSGSAVYSLGFTSAALLPESCRIVAEHYLEAGDWGLARKRILSTNALQCRSASSAERQEGELRHRLVHLTLEQLQLLARATAEDRAALSWLAACKHIRFAFEFAAEVLRDKLAAHDPVLRLSDYETYVEHKSLLHPELVRLSPSSRPKIRQVLMKMLVEAGLLGPGEALGAVTRPALSPEVARVVSEDSPRLLSAFLVPDEEIQSR